LTELPVSISITFGFIRGHNIRSIHLYILIAVKKRIAITLSPEAICEGKKAAGIAAFSAYIEDLIKKDVDRHNKEEQA